ncbi:MAG: sigma factor [Acetivibrionales bacterium]
MQHFAAKKYEDWKVEDVSYRSCRSTDFEASVTRHENSLFRAALAIMGNVSDAGDILQETFLRAYEKAPEFASDKHERAWLMKPEEIYDILKEIGVSL